MGVLVTTLNKVLGRADQHLDAGRLQAARAAFEELLQLSQERSDRPMEVIARSMLASCALKRRDLEAASALLREAARQIDPVHHRSYGRYRSVLARVALERGPPETAKQELLDYLRWAEDAASWAEVVDSCLLLAELEEPSFRSHWLERGIEAGLRGDVHDRLGRAYSYLAATRDQLGEIEEALEAYQQAHRWHSDVGTPREQTAAAWAVGSLAVRTEDFPLARERLEQCIEQAESREDCADLLALATADLAMVYEAAGDVIEARRLVLRALDLAEEEELGTVWPQRWEALLDHAHRLELR